MVNGMNAGRTRSQIYQLVVSAPRAVCISANDGPIHRQKWLNCFTHNIIFLKLTLTFLRNI